MWKRALILTTIVVIILLIAVPAPKELPPSSIEAIPEIYVSYLPVIKFEKYQKGGFAWGYQKVQQDADEMNIGWYHDWYFNKSTLNTPKVLHIPCTYDYWGDKSRDIFADFQSKVPATYDDYLLFLNEPDRPDQCLMTPDDAADFYIAVREYVPNAKIIGPQTSHGDIYGNNYWLRQFFNAVIAKTGAPPDIYAYSAHIYHFLTPQQTVQNLKEVMRYYDLTAPIWVTEIGYCDYQEAYDAVVYMESEPTIERYAWFSPRIPQNLDWYSCTTLYNPDSTLSPAGLGFMSARTDLRLR